ncbi:MAG: hypothetical protein ABSD47_09835 [Candidatus Methylomirabilota bacterium]|jgi:hypothetical protein
MSEDPASEFKNRFAEAVVTVIEMSAAPVGDQIFAAGRRAVEIGAELDETGGKLLDAWTKTARLCLESLDSLSDSFEVRQLRSSLQDALVVLQCERMTVGVEIPRVVDLPASSGDP